MKLGSNFDSEELTVKVGQMLIDVLGKSLEKKWLGRRMTDGYFFINNVTFQSVRGDEVKVQVEYEYGV